MMTSPRKPIDGLLAFFFLLFAALSIALLLLSFYHEKRESQAFVYLPSHLCARVVKSCNWETSSRAAGLIAVVSSKADCHELVVAGAEDIVFTRCSSLVLIHVTCKVGST